MKYLVWLAALTFGLVWPMPAVAQIQPPDPGPAPDGASSIYVEPLVSSADAAKQMADQRLGRAKGSSALQTLAEEVLKHPEQFRDLFKDMDPQQIEKMKKALGNWTSQVNPNDPKLNAALTEFIEKNPDLAQQLTKGHKDDAKKLLDESKAQMQEQANQGNNPQNDPHVKKPEEKAPNAGDAKPKDPEQPESAKAPNSPEEQEKRAKTGKGILRFLGKLKGLNGGLPKTSQLGKAVLDMLNKGDGSGTKGDVKLAALSTKLGLDKVLGRLGGESMPALSKLTGMFSQRPVGGGGGMDSFGGSSAPDPGRASMVLLWLVLAVGAGIIIWRLLAWRESEREATRKSWRLGPWPLHPGGVATRGQLIQAFEYLSVLLLGAPARHWNHRQIATRLGLRKAMDADEQQRAAQALAELYELARYAPPEEPLADQELAVARRNLCYLAGMAAS